MEWRPFFHDPDVCLPVIRRRAGELLLDLLGWYGQVVRTSGRSLWWQGEFASRTSYCNAVDRLRKAGLVVSLKGPARERTVRLTDAGLRRRPETFDPERFWNRRWAGFWYVLAYDVPETQKGSRDALRSFLTRLRMGRLQWSVYVSAHDVRPEYDDLAKAAAIEDLSFLFESRTVLGRNPTDVVRAAWDFDLINDRQSQYCAACEHNRHTLGARLLSLDDLQKAAVDEMTAFLAAMADDPLLPRELWPSDYRGPEVLARHREFVEVTAACLSRL